LFIVNSPESADCPNTVVIGVFPSALTAITLTAPFLT
jgi:hypothetical protein